MASNIFTFNTRKRWMVSFRPGPFCPNKITSVMHWIGRWVCLRFRLNVFVK
jgi:hypothetical protein